MFKNPSPNGIRLKNNHLDRRDECVTNDSYLACARDVEYRSAAQIMLLPCPPRRKLHTDLAKWPVLVRQTRARWNLSCSNLLQHKEDCDASPARMQPCTKYTSMKMHASVRRNGENIHADHESYRKLMILHENYENRPCNHENAIYPPNTCSGKGSGTVGLYCQMITDLKLQLFHRLRNHDHLLPWMSFQLQVACCLRQVACTNWH